MKNAMKKLFAVLFCVLLIALAAGCKSVAPDSGNNGGNDDDGDQKPEVGAFTVRLECEGKPYVPEIEMGAVWTTLDGFTQTEPVMFNDKGVASRTGLDGYYTVRLTAVPSGFTYDPNIYTVNSDSKDVTIELFPLTRYSGKGTGFDAGRVIKISKTGAYRVTLNQAGQQVYFCFSPGGEGGIYEFESINDIALNEINPRMDVYSGGSFWWSQKPEQSVNTGGESSIYTKNFKYETQIGSGSSACIFVIKGDSRVGFPVNVDFKIVRKGNIEQIQQVYDLIVPQENFYDESGRLKKTPEINVTFTYVGKTSGGRTVLDGSRVKKGEDGYYRYQDEDGKEYMLYAKLTQTNRLVHFLGVDAESGASVNLRLRVNDQGKDYTYFIGGYQNYVQKMGGEAYISPDVMAKLEAIGKVSYFDCVNSDGVYAVNDEIKNFLYDFSVANYYFFDGYGWGELNGIDSSDSNQWLFACGYYKV